MVSRNKIIWSEGLFIKPQHFQQQQRHVEYRIDKRISAVSHYAYGITSLSLNTSSLGLNRYHVRTVTGVMPDGTVFNVPEESLLNDYLEVPNESYANQIIYLAIPLQSDEHTEISRENAPGSGRYVEHKEYVRDNESHSENIDSSLIDVAKGQLKLMFEKEDRSSFASIPLARVSSKHSGSGLTLDDDFIPCHSNVNSISSLKTFLTEISALMKERAQALAKRLGDAEQGSVADVSDFMLLQALNRMQPEMHHLSLLSSLHPEKLYEKLVCICGELATFTSEGRVPPNFSAYDHDNPTDLFNPMMNRLRQSLSIVMTPRAVSIEIEKRQYGLMVAPIHDSSLTTNAEFIIAVKARMKLETLRDEFVHQMKVASVEKITELVSRHLPGIPLVTLPVAPRQLPYHAGYTYFQLDKSSPSWQQLSSTSGFAFHVGGHFPDLDIQFWAIRS